jgi:hypothetical protein
MLFQTRILKRWTLGIILIFSFFSYFDFQSLMDYKIKNDTTSSLEKLSFNYINDYQIFDSTCNPNGTQHIKSNTYYSGASDLNIITSSSASINAFVWMEKSDNYYCNTPFIKDDFVRLNSNEAIVSNNFAKFYGISINDTLTTNIENSNFDYTIVKIIEEFNGFDLRMIDQKKDGLIILGYESTVFDNLSPFAKSLEISLSTLFNNENSIILEDSIIQIKNSVLILELSFGVLLLMLILTLEIMFMFNYSWSFFIIEFNLYGDLDLGLAYKRKLGYGWTHLLLFFSKFGLLTVFFYSVGLIIIFTFLSLLSRLFVVATLSVLIAYSLSSLLKTILIMKVIK